MYDPRPDLREHVASILPLYLPPPAQDSEENGDASASVQALLAARVTFSATLAEAVATATIIQEQGPENEAFKQKTWSEVLRATVAAGNSECHLWSSTSGIPASRQLAHLGGGGEDDHDHDDVAESARSRLLVVHPFNPPHLMPLIEVVPSPHTAASRVSFAQSFFTSTSPLHRPIAIHQEVPGFVANRLSFILFREACSLVAQGVCSVQELDEVVRASLGPRWAVGGPFQMYNFGGAGRGLGGFLENIGGAIGDVWRDSDGRPGIQIARGEEWEKIVTEQTIAAYGVPGGEDVKRRDRGLKEVVRVQQELEGGAKQAS